MYYKRNAVDGRMQAAGAGAYNPGGLEGEVKGTWIFITFKCELHMKTDLKQNKPCRLSRGFIIV